MSRILLDGWTFTSYVAQLFGHTDGIQAYSPILCKSNLLTGIIFWDKIDIISSRYILIEKLKENDSANKLLSLCNFINPQEYIENDSEVVKIPEFKLFDSGAVGLNFQNEHSFSRFDEELAYLLIKRAEIYLDVSDKLGINYFPHPNRAEYLLDQNLFKSNFNRYKLIEILDKALVEYYDELNREYENNLLSFSYPVLYDYIRKETDSPIEELEVALKLRDDKEVKALRQSLDCLDRELNRGNRPAVIDARKQIGEITKFITNNYSKKGKIKIGNIKIGLSLPFGMGVNVEVPKIVNIPIKLQNNLARGKKIINLTFLNRLRDFGLGKY